MEYSVGFICESVVGDREVSEPRSSEGALVVSDERPKSVPLQRNVV